MMPVRRRFAAYLALFAALAGLAACVSLVKPTPDKRYFTLDPAPPAARVKTIERAVLVVRKVRLSPRCEGKGFVYRNDEHEYEADYYNEFFVAPDAMIGEAVARYLAASGPFPSVAQGGAVLPTHSLEVSVAALHADYRESSSPKAVLEMQFLLLDEREDDAGPLIQIDLAQAVPFEPGSPAALAAAWSDALAAILRDLAAALAAADIKAPPAPTPTPVPVTPSPSAPSATPPPPSPTP